ncbi:carbon-nitrogen hydrolase [Scheffersomyces coipomensis]|uniref:carbon-nitrogen hydrolase n=1 Tax=Scheffersomyces coipomensis TaxID=1788519 RepID=UPI00315DBE31
MNSIKLKVACLQYNPRIGQIESNIVKVKQLLSKAIKRDHLDEKSIDMIVLPELAITGYNFKNKQEIESSLNNLDALSGQSIKFGQELSQLYQCFIVMGYPELKNQKIYNSCLLISPQGSILHNYRKSFLYETDEVWGCNENPERGFKSLDIILDREYYLQRDTTKIYPKVRVNFGICMDLNPYKFEAPFNAFEFSLSCYQQLSKLIICPMAWLSPQSPSITKETGGLKIENDSEPDTSTVNYWILRFFPFLNHKNSILPKNFEKVNVICCNRVGLEDDVLYGGSTSIFEFNGNDGLISNAEIDDKNPSVKVLGSLGKNNEEVLIKDIEVEIN